VVAVGGLVVGGVVVYAAFCQLTGAIDLVRSLAALRRRA
jgi:hypothetical protein